MEWFAKDPAFFVNMGIVAVMFVGFYFLIIRPQKKEDKRRELFLSNLKIGDKVITAGGIYGVLIGLGEQKVTLRVAEKIEIELLRSAVSRFQDPVKQELLEKDNKNK
jgi:preprotein translocase subunit YajC